MDTGPWPPNQDRLFGPEASPHSAGPQAPPFITIPDHELLRCIGRGSYGTVWLARNVMGAYRAVKIIYRESFDDERPFEREYSGIQKFEPVSRSHEGFVDVLHVGKDQAGSCFYYIMELGDDALRGQDIQPDSYSPKTLGGEVRRRGRLSLTECLDLGIALSQALAALHKLQLVHRDIKPANIIFVMGVPKLADSGLVALADSARSFVGTEGFIPPEGPGTPQADVYALGKVLYEASTGKDRQDFPELPDDVDQWPDHQLFLELNEILIQACANSLDRRYASADAMRKDLLLIAGGKSVRRLKLLETRWLRLKRLALTSLGVALVLAALAFYGYREWRHVIEERERLVGANVAYGNQAMASGDLLGALPFFAEAFESDQESAAAQANHHLRVRSVLEQCPKLTTLAFASTRLNSAQFSPDGSRLILAEFFRNPILYEPATGKTNAPFGSRAGLFRAAFNHDGSQILAAYHDSSACVWDAGDGRLLLTLPHPDRVNSILSSPDGRDLVTACKDGRARIFRDLSPEPRLLVQHAGPVTFAAFSPDAHYLATTSQDGTARIWDARDGTPVCEPLVHPRWVGAAAFSPDSRFLVTVCNDGNARLWEVPEGRRIRPDLKHKDVLRAAEFSPDGRIILTASYDGTVRLWSALTLEPLQSNPILRHGERVTHAAFAPDGQRIVSTCNDGSVRVWSLAGAVHPFQAINLAAAHSSHPAGTHSVASPSDPASRSNPFSRLFHSVSSLTAKPLDPKTDRYWLSEDGTALLTLSSSTNAQRIQVLNLKAPGTAPLLDLAATPSARVHLSPNGHRMAITDQSTVQVWDVYRRERLYSGIPIEGMSATPSFSRKGDLLAFRSGTKLHLWNLATRAFLYPPLDHGMTVAHVEFSPDDSLFATTCSSAQLDRCSARVWHTRTGAPAGPQLWHADGVTSASFDPMMQRIVTAGEDFKAVVWDFRSGKALTRPMPHEHQVHCARFDPTGRLIVTVSPDGTASVWSAETGDPLTPPLRHFGQPSEAVFIAGNSQIFTCDRTGQSWLWPLPSDPLSAQDASALGRLLSGERADQQSSNDRIAALSATWIRLRTRHPDLFQTHPQEITAWHQLQALQSESDQNWAAVAFHLQQLQSHRPRDPVILERLKALETNLRQAP